MAVLVEAISVVVRADRLLARMAWDDFVTMVPNATLCADDELVRVGWTGSRRGPTIYHRLEETGLRYLENGASVDMIVIDQQRGPMAQCEMIEVGAIPFGPREGHAVSAARLVGSSRRQLLTPDGWQYEGSLSQTFRFVPANRREDGP